MINDVVRMAYGILAFILLILMGAYTKILIEAMQRKKQTDSVKIWMLAYLKDLLVATKPESFLVMENNGPDLHNYTQRTENISYYKHGEYLLYTGGSNGGV
ncbi:MAG: hypothetical protein HDQ95_05230 [Roseburia sp.]|nr:hypothetical protein [Roseburia sp.]